MNFISVGFLFFLITTLLIFVLLPAKWRVYLIWIASYIFYACWSLDFIGIILLSTSIDYYLSHYLFHSRSQSCKKALLLTGIGINLLILGLFKYYGFLVLSGQGLFSLFGLSFPLPYMSFILPLGISFYTFEAIAYLVDVYRGEKPAANWLEYNFFIMFFPHLISGPIIRFDELRTQYAKPLQLPSAARIASGLELIVLGFCFKIIIADQASPLEGMAFQWARASDPLQTLIGVLAFTVQIYFDFMAYTHIARGAALLFNIQLPLNFNHPYNAENISDFWRRWHITLSRWLQDYLYIPLGGSKQGPNRTMRNLLLTILVAGAWHGASWMYVLWGAYHGLLLAIYHAYRTWRIARFGKNPTFLSHPIYNLAATVLTFICTSLGWILFRSQKWDICLLVYKNLFNFNWWLSLDPFTIKNIQSLSMAGLLLTCCFTGPYVVGLVKDRYEQSPQLCKAYSLALLMLVCWIVLTEESTPFIYFRF